MIGDVLTLSKETTTAKLPDCKDGEEVTISVTGVVKLVDGAIVLDVQPESVEKSYKAGEPVGDDAGSSDVTGGGMAGGKMSPGVAAMMSRGK